VFVILIVKGRALQEKKSTDSQKFAADFNEVEVGIRVRILDALGERSRSDLARMTLESTANVSRYLKNKKISMRFFWATARALSLNPGWLLTGEGPRKTGAIDWSSVPYDELQERAAQQRLQLEKNIMAFNEQVKPFLGGSLHNMAHHGPGFKRPAPPEPSMVEESSRIIFKDRDELPTDPDERRCWVDVVTRIAAGHGGMDASEAEHPAQRYVYCDDPPPHAVAAVVSGDSMEPEYRAGDVVIASVDRPAKAGVCIVVLKHDGERMPMVKVLNVRGRRAFLKSLNERVETKDYPVDEIEAYEVVRHLTR
jgi:SOS-response transcriptional repressor LexA